jgi:hypothetical protein
MHEWVPEAEQVETAQVINKVLDSNGIELHNGDAIVYYKRPGDQRGCKSIKNRDESEEHSPDRG